MPRQHTRRARPQPAPAEPIADTQQPSAAPVSLNHSFGAVPLHGLPIQAKLTVGAADDAYEREADHVADLVMSAPEAEEQPAISPLGAGGLHTSREGAAGSFDAGAAFEQQLGSAGGGSPLPEATRAFMEPRFGADFSGVRLHTGGEAAQLSRQVSAQAFTHGSDIYMGEGHTNIGSGDGQRLLAHELTHVVQQTGGVARKPVVQRKLVGDLGQVTRDGFWNQLKARDVKIPFGILNKLFSEVTNVQNSTSYASIDEVIAAFANKEPYASYLSSANTPQASAPAPAPAEASNVVASQPSASPVATKAPAIPAREDLEEKPATRMMGHTEAESSVTPPVATATQETTFAPQSNFDATDLTIRIHSALDSMTFAELKKETIIANLERAFGTMQTLHEATRDPVFAEELLKTIQGKQSQNWQKKTKIREVGQDKEVSAAELSHWTVRHYTSKIMVTLGEDLGDGIFTIAAVNPPPFSEILSSITLATAPGSAADGASSPKKMGDEMLISFSTGAGKSGHTTENDWTNIGNVGDTFYGLFYDGQPATGITPNFIQDATYYAEWTAEEFGVGWASADWLTTAKHSQEENGKTPGGVARQGTLSAIVGDILGLLRNQQDLSDNVRQGPFKAMDNFEVKKHGPMTVKAWNEVSANVGKVSNWQVNANTGTFKKNKGFPFK